MNNGHCPLCGGVLIGDGYTDVIRCENAPEWLYDCVEPDAEVVLCRFVEDSRFSNREY